jgi:uncharacterized Zn finger protein
MDPVKCKSCGFSLELVEIRANQRFFRCSTCGKQEIVEIERISPELDDNAASEADSGSEASESGVHS